MLRIAPVAAAPASSADWLPSTGEIDHLLAAARSAPSAENHHRIQLRWDGLFRIRLHLDQAWGALDRQTAFLAEMAIGAMVENIRLAAGGIGLVVEETWDWRAASGEPVAVLRLRRGGVPDPHLEMAAIWRRCTNRRMYRREALPADQVDRLSAAVTGMEGMRLDWITSPAARSQMAGLARRAEGVRFVSRHLHHEVFAGIRLDIGWHSSCARGLPPGALEIEPPLRPAFALLRCWSLCRVLAWGGLGWGLGIRAGWLPIRQSGALAVISGHGDGRRDAVLAGRTMQRLWLAAASEGLSVQPMPAAALFTLPWWQGVPERVCRDLRRSWRSLLPDRQPLMVLRLGRAEAPSVRTCRDLAEA